MTYQTNAGATFGVSTAAPATYDEAGYEALSFTTVGAGSIVAYNPPKAEWELATDNSWNANDKADLKASRKLGNGDITLRVDSDDSAFWTIIDAAEASKTQVLSIELVHGNGVDNRFYTAQIGGASESYNGPNDWLVRDVMLISQKPIVRGTV